MFVIFYISMNIKYYNYLINISIEYREEIKSIL